MDLKAKDKLQSLQNIIMFDEAEEVHFTLASQDELQLFNFSDLVAEGRNIPDL